ncbi:MAG: hypothetical protein LBV72_09730 [Tannerella sp.]|jgi:hypothetical protein|nr:hypothetical protein [Tannerella sp.]
MDKLILSLLIGLIAGIIDIIPMILQMLDKHSIVSAFLQYIFVSVIIINIDLPYVVWWLEGGLISLALSLPIVVLVSAKDKSSVPIILTMSIILGTLIGLAGHYWA